MITKEPKSKDVDLDWEKEWDGVHHIGKTTGIPIQGRTYTALCGERFQSVGKFLYQAGPEKLCPICKSLI